MFASKTRRIRVGVQIAPQHLDIARLRELVLEIETMGADAVFLWDHFFPLTGDRAGAHFEAWSLLASWAELTTRVEIGTLVSCAGFRNPDLLADMARTVDHLSAHADHGRLILGVGAGWAERDFTEYGYPFPLAGRRIDELGRSTACIRARWERLMPPPTRRIPVLIGGDGERKTLRVVAMQADIWHSFAGPADLARKAAILHKHCAVVGRNPHEIEISTTARIQVRGANVDTSVVDAQHQVGATFFIASLTPPRIALEPVRHLLTWRDNRNAALDAQAM
ncbi:LLM class F420-dependent oxidoreductase [Rathayibacter toxicus]|uniref:5,10-methylene tetrahydromethanopterin reductase n=1 Tax=Rathayibacter toxicus TaxID=145458 RepID=A0A0C5BFE6_9MICO|nr:LLM class F420-dependent oxidoreductase [Rathayibacter toxicus]AJM77824.1 5,10-methylene tetrahydromethanopterin reductase [Rathayibacter toxicus]ALS57992.1 LLM class F420-dependent oxidoreductase [Rathayibacter toxicus]KKM44297.1 5,10-methylene tetrahydromethanopterin reductase [Rathayibacter toxicus]PPG20322.1 LLM class F420-dependent oxidoreductase [Rathayibacter toxicus]PPG45423.1 LLM class F420-dependent oxidoreductase [Rathayibacter toxicus]